MDEVRGVEAKNARSVAVGKWYRIYPNLSGQWLVDDGTIAIRCFKVIMASDKPVYTEIDGGNTWILAFGVMREVTDNKGRVVITIMKK